MKELVSACRIIDAGIGALAQMSARYGEADDEFHSAYTALMDAWVTFQRVVQRRARDCK